MLIAVGEIDVNSLIDGIIPMARDETSTHELHEENGKGGWKHCDGWGIAYLSLNGEWIVKKSTKAIYKDPDINLFRNVKTNLMTSPGPTLYGTIFGHEKN